MIVQSPFYLSVDDIPKDVNFVEFFLNKVQQYGSDVALIDSTTHFKCTFDQLPYFVKCYQEFYEQCGITKDDHVAVISLNYSEFIFTQLALGSLGAVPVCINPLATAYETTYYLNLSDCNFALVEKTYETKIGGLKTQVPLLKKVVSMPKPEAFLCSMSAKTNLKVKATNRCILMNFSSGTTGKPKAVETFHRAMVANVIITSIGIWNIPKGHTQERSLMIIPLHHAYGGTIVYHELFNGYTVITMPRFNDKGFLQIVQDFKITTAHLVPPIVQFLATSPLVDSYDISSLKYVVSGSAPLSSSVAQACKNRLGLKDIRMLYGMSEIRIPTWLPYGSNNLSSIGSLTPNTKMKVVDPVTGIQCSEPGQVGELWFTGVQVVEGQYYKNPEANAGFYVNEGETIWTRTGDCGYFDSSGLVYLTDRHKDLIKYKGFQVSPLELENLIRTNKCVLDCAVVGKPDEEAGELPAAFIVPCPEYSQKQIETEINAVLKEKLSTYKQLKGGIYFVDVIPRSAAGKLSRTNLIESMKSNKSKL